LFARSEARGGLTWRTRGRAFGLDRVRVGRSGNGWEIVDETGLARSLRVVFDDGRSTTVAAGAGPVVVK
jgi:hypothetical protein